MKTKSKFSDWVVKMHKKNIFSEKPNPLWVFILAFLALGLGFWALPQNRAISSWFFCISGFTFIFGILHWTVVLILRKEKGKK